jgi:putative transposase
MVAPYAGTNMIPAERAGTAIFIPVTNAIEALNSKLRRAVRARGHFPSDEAATKLLFLVLNRSEKEWIMPPREWCMAKAQFAVLFGERFTRAMA